MDRYISFRGTRSSVCMCVCLYVWWETKKYRDFLEVTVELRSKEQPREGCGEG